MLLFYAFLINFNSLQMLVHKPKQFTGAEAVFGRKLDRPRLSSLALLKGIKLWRIKRICVFERSVMTNFNCACPAIQRGQGSGFLSEGFS